MLPLELKEFIHNIKDHDYDICGQYKVDKSEADKVIKQLERLDKIFVNADEIKPDDEIFKDDYSDKNTQNGWIYCKDRLPKLEENEDGDIESEYVLVIDKGKEYDVCKLSQYKSGEKFWRSYMYDMPLELMVAWMPLPEWEVEE